MNWNNNSSLEKKLTKHFINGDNKCNIFEDLIYILFFFIEIINEKKIIQNNSNFNNFQNYNYNDSNFFDKSPSRILCESYLLNWLSKNFNRSDNINILDVGCGTGVSLEVFKKYFKKIKYLGCDIKKRNNWDQMKDENISFIEHEIGKRFNQNLGEFDLVYSQSVFEHIEYDLSVFEILANDFKKAKNIHFVPAAISFLNYQKHGFRRYTHNSLVKLKKHLKHEMKFCGLGGARTLRYHFNFLQKNNIKGGILSNALKKIMKYNNNHKTEKELIDFLITDNAKNFPIFYAVEF